MGKSKKASPRDSTRYSRSLARSRSIQRRCPSSSNPDQLASIGRALVVGQKSREPLGSAELYRLMERLMLVRDELGPLERISDEELELFFAAAARVAELEEVPPWAKGTPSAELRIDEYTRIINKAIDRGQRKELRRRKDDFLQLPSLGIWRRAILDGIGRVALAVSGISQSCSFGAT